MKRPNEYQWLVPLYAAIALMGIGTAHAQITTNEAIVIAARACDGKIDINTNAPPVITTTNGQVTVFFASNVPTNALGPGFAAMVTLDAKTGKLIEILAGPD